MAFTSGSRQAAAMAAGWLFAAGCTVVSIAYFSEIKASAQSLLGVQVPTARVGVGERDGQAGPLSGTGSAGRTVELKAGAYGHFHAHAEINGQSISVMVDTGASIVALTFDDARAAGLYVRDSDFTHRVSTANGFARIAPVTIDVSGAVMEQGKLGTTLLGMSFLSRLQRVDIRSGMLVLHE